MKRLIYAILSLTLLWACDMEEFPKSQISSKPIFGTETGLEMYTNSFYNALPGSTTRVTDSYYIAKNQIIKYLTANGFSPEESWGWDWGTLRNINYFIVNCKDNAVPEVTRNNYLGIARFFRAYFYFDKMTRFGDLPWIGHPLEVDDPILYAGRDPRTLIIDSIKADLDFAIKNIKAAKDPSCSTITSTVAAAMKSRICLWEGTFRKYHTEAGLQASADQWLKEAVDASQIVMNAGYSIYKGKGADLSYRSLFISSVPVAEEVLYAVTYNQGLGVTHSGNRQWTSSTLGNCPSLTRSFVNTYLMLDGTPFTNKAGYASTPFTDECKDRDKRLAQTVRTPGFTRITSGKTVPAAPVYTFAITGYHTCKFTLDDSYYDNVDNCDNNVVLFRYAEVLLNYAEAKAELGTLTDDDWSKTIGTLRARAGITGGLNSKPTVADPYLQSCYFPGISNPEILEIRRERGIELSFEGFSWDDVCRWKTGKLLEKEWDGIYIPALDVPYDMNEDGTLDVCFTKNLKTENPVPGVYYLFVGDKLPNGAESNTQLGEDGHTLMFMKNQKRTWDDKLYFYPIPANDLVKNPNLKQNPGWE